MKYIKLFIIAFCFVAGVSGLGWSQSGNPSTSGKFVLKNDAGNTLTLAIPSSGVTNYMLTFPSIVGATGSMPYLTNSTGSLGWTAPGTNGQVLTIVGGVPAWANPSNSGGTVTSVGLAMPSIFTVTGSPVTTSGTLTAALTNENANLVFAGPSTGAAATPTFRALTSSDIPNLSNNYIVNGTTLQTANYHISGNGEMEGQLQLKGTGTGLTTFQAGAQGATNINYTLPITAPTAGQILSSSATGVLSWINQSNGGGGTVTSVGLAMPSIFTVSGSPVTTSGTLTAALANENANLVFAGPSTGASATPTFRALTSSDIPNLSNNYIVNGTTLQTANFNISGNGDIGGLLQFQGTGTGVTTFKAGAQGATNINYTLPITAPTAGQILSSNASGVLSWINQSNGGGGTVTSVGLAMPSIFTVTGSPVTTSGTLTAALANENANLVFAGPSTGAAATPTFRALTSSDIPNLSNNYIVNGTTLQTANYHISGNGEMEGQLQLKGTGTGLTTFQAGQQGATNLNYTLPFTAPTANQVLVSSGGAASNLSWTDASSLLSGNYWSLSGNNTSSAYNGTTGDFLGTTSTQPLVIATTNTTTAQPIELFTNNTERVRIESNGYVGVGVTSPKTQLDLNGAVTLRPGTPATITASGEITVGNRSYIRITHDANAATYTMTLSNGLQDGQVLIIHCQGIDGTHPFKFADGGTLDLSGDFVPNTNDSTISLIWDGSEWIETARSLN